jgi:mannose-6-phosphate isomerase-like protein (cupin superfamily)
MPSDVNVTAIEWDASERFVSLRRALGVTSFGLNQITLQSRQRGRIHRHREQEEVYLVLRGSLTIAFEDKELELAEGQLIRVPPATRRQLLNRGDKPCVLLAIGGAGEHVGRDGEAFGAWSETVGRPPQEVPVPADLPELDGPQG